MSQSKGEWLSTVVRSSRSFFFIGITGPASTSLPRRMARVVTTPRPLPLMGTSLSRPTSGRTIFAAGTRRLSVQAWTPAREATVGVLLQQRQSGVARGFARNTRVCGPPSVALPPVQVVRVDVVEADVADVALAHQRHGGVGLLADDFEGTNDTDITAGTEAEGHDAPDEGALGAEREGLEQILAGADAAIHQHFGLVADGIDDLGQDANGGGRAIELAAAVVGHDNGIGAVVDGELGVILVEDALDDHRAAEALLDPGDVLPVEREVELRSGPFCQRGEVHRVGNVAGDVAEGAAIGAEHAQGPARLHRHFRHEAGGELGRRAEAVAQVLVA